MTVDEWVSLYRDALPVELRPRRGDDRVLLAAVDALASGWAPRQMAALVKRQSYIGVTNPILIGITHLESWAGGPPETNRPKPRGQHPNGCVVCPPWVVCESPATRADRLPEAWVHERFDLMRELRNTPDLTEDGREDAMRRLIAAQQQRGLQRV